MDIEVVTRSQSVERSGRASTMVVEPTFAWFGRIGDC